jgi:hypothetical protein
LNRSYIHAHTPVVSQKVWVHPAVCLQSEARRKEIFLSHLQCAFVYVRYGTTICRCCTHRTWFSYPLASRRLDVIVLALLCHLCLRSKQEILTDVSVGACVMYAGMYACLYVSARVSVCVHVCPYVSVCCVCVALKAFRIWHTSSTCVSVSAHLP